MAVPRRRRDRRRARGVLRQHRARRWSCSTSWSGTRNRRRRRTWHRRAADRWDWRLRYPMKNDVWANYFEDVPWQPDTKNVNQFVAGELARYLLEHPDQDPEWRDHAQHLIAWIERTFGGDTPSEPGLQWGAIAISEQAEYIYKMGSHTSRFASLRRCGLRRPVMRRRVRRRFDPSTGPATCAIRVASSRRSTRRDALVQRRLRRLPAALPGRTGCRAGMGNAGRNAPLARIVRGARGRVCSGRGALPGLRRRR